MAESYLFGLEHSNHVFDGAHPKSFGKNIFTNAFPVALACYMDSVGIGPMLVHVEGDASGDFAIRQDETPFAEIIGGDVQNIRWLFETGFDGYGPYATNQARRSDVVAQDMTTGEHLRPFEVKLVTVPNSATAHLSREQYGCEIVTRPPTVEQLCFSIARSFGVVRRQNLASIIASALINPMDFDWANERYMLQHFESVLSALRSVISEGIDNQTPFALNAIWRTKGQAPILDAECFDVFVWSDMAFADLFRRTSESQPFDRKTGGLARHARSVVWLVKSLFDYAVQGTVTFERTHSAITYGGQTDKAGAFSGNRLHPYLFCDEFVHPRVADRSYRDIIAAEGVALLKPERRLDAALVSADALGQYISMRG